MGLKVHYVGRKQQFRSLEDNVADIVAHYPMNNGYFGVEGSSVDIRVIYTRDYEAAAKDFFNRIAKGGILDLRLGPKGVISIMKDKTYITYRKITKTPNSPAVEIRFRNLKSKYGIKDQKIHFEGLK